MAKPKSGGLLENVKTIVYAVIIAVVIRTFAFEPFNIPSGSMIPTLLIGDYLLVSKYSYGYSRYSFPLSPPLFSGRIPDWMPKRGDVAVFKDTFDTSSDYIKRIIGLPGDHVQMRQGHLFINNQEVPRVPAGTYQDDSDGIPVPIARYTETLPNGRSYHVLKATDEGEMNNTQDFVVPPGDLFAMGDNRDNSADSRVQMAPGVGYLPIENLVGHAEIIFFSIDSRYPWWQVWEWPFEIRWSRLFLVIR